MKYKEYYENHKSELLHNLEGFTPHDIVDAANKENKSFQQIICELNGICL